MKYIKPRYDFILILNPLLITLSALFYFFYPSIATHCFYAYWISTAALLFLLCTRPGNYHLAQHSDDIATRLPWQQWLLCIFILEITLFGVYLGMCYVCGNAFPVNITPHAYLFSNTLRTELLHFGLFPWSLYAIIATGMAVLAYREDTNAYFSNLLKPWMPDEPGERFGIIVNVVARRCTLFAMSILFTFMTFVLMSLAISPDIQLVIGFKVPALLTTLILLFLTYMKIAKRYTAKLFIRRIPTGIAFPIFCLALCFIILFFNTLIAGLVQQKIASENIPRLITRWIQRDWNTAWSLFSVMFWMSLTPLVCNFIVKISRGYRIREMMISVLFLPLIFTLVLYFKHDVMISPHMAKIVSLISFFILLPILVNHGNSGNAIFSYFPKHGMIKHRDEKHFFENITQLTIVAIYLYLVIGINGLGIFMFAPLFLFCLPLMVIAVAIVWNIRSHS